jgi:hypothetical protein
MGVQEIRLLEKATARPGAISARVINPATRVPDIECFERHMAIPGAELRAAVHSHTIAANHRANCRDALYEQLSTIAVARASRKWLFISPELPFVQRLFSNPSFASDGIPGQGASITFMMPPTHACVGSTRDTARLDKLLAAMLVTGDKYKSVKDAWKDRLYVTIPCDIGLCGIKMVKFVFSTLQNHIAPYDYVIASFTNDNYPSSAYASIMNEGNDTVIYELCYRIDVISILTIDEPYHLNGVSVTKRGDSKDSDVEFCVGDTPNNGQRYVTTYGNMMARNSQHISSGNFCLRSSDLYYNDSSCMLVRELNYIERVRSNACNFSNYVSFPNYLCQNFSSFIVLPVSLFEQCNLAYSAPRKNVDGTEKTFEEYVEHIRRTMLVREKINTMLDSDCKRIGTTLQLQLAVFFAFQKLAEEKRLAAVGAFHTSMQSAMGRFRASFLVDGLERTALSMFNALRGKGYNINEVLKSKEFGYQAYHTAAPRVQHHEIRNSFFTDANSKMSFIYDEIMQKADEWYDPPGEDGCVNKCLQRMALLTGIKHEDTNYSHDISSILLAASAANVAVSAPFLGINCVNKDFMIFLEEDYNSVDFSVHMMFRFKNSKNSKILMKNFHHHASDCFRRLTNLVTFEDRLTWLINKLWCSDTRHVLSGTWRSSLVRHFSGQCSDEKIWQKMRRLSKFEKRKKICCDDFCMALLDSTQPSYVLAKDLQNDQTIHAIYLHFSNDSNKTSLLNEISTKSIILNDDLYHFSMGFLDSTKTGNVLRMLPKNYEFEEYALRLSLTHREYMKNLLVHLCSKNGVDAERDYINYEKEHLDEFYNAVKCIEKDALHLISKPWAKKYCDMLIEKWGLVRDFSFIDRIIKYLNCKLNIKFRDLDKADHEQLITAMIVKHGCFESLYRSLSPDKLRSYLRASTISTSSLKSVKCVPTFDESQKECVFFHDTVSAFQLLEGVEIRSDERSSFLDEITSCPTGESVLARQQSWKLPPDAVMLVDNIDSLCINRTSWGPFASDLKTVEDTTKEMKDLSEDMTLATTLGLSELVAPAPDPKPVGNCEEKSNSLSLEEERSIFSDQSVALAVLTSAQIDVKMSYEVTNGETFLEILSTQERKGISKWLLGLCETPLCVDHRDKILTKLIAFVDEEGLTVEKLVTGPRSSLNAFADALSIKLSKRIAYQKIGISIINGTPGSGKTRSTINAVKSCRGTCSFISPTRALADDLKDSLQDVAACHTHEVAIYSIKSGCSTLIIDEFAKLETFFHKINAVLSGCINVLCVGDTDQCSPYDSGIGEIITHKARRLTLLTSWTMHQDIASVADYLYRNPMHHASIKPLKGNSNFKPQIFKTSTADLAQMNSAACGFKYISNTKDGTVHHGRTANAMQGTRTTKLLAKFVPAPRQVRFRANGTSYFPDSFVLLSRINCTEDSVVIIDNTSDPALMRRLDALSLDGHVKSINYEDFIRMFGPTCNENDEEVNSFVISEEGMSIYKRSADEHIGTLLHDGINTKINLIAGTDLLKGAADKLRVHVNPFSKSVPTNSVTYSRHFAVEETHTDSDDSASIVSQDVRNISHDGASIVSQDVRNMSKVVADEKNQTSKPADALRRVKGKNLVYGIRGMHYTYDNSVVKGVHTEERYNVDGACRHSRDVHSKFMLSTIPVDSMLICENSTSPYLTTDTVNSLGSVEGEGFNHTNFDVPIIPELVNHYEELKYHEHGATSTASMNDSVREAYKTLVDNKVNVSLSITRLMDALKTKTPGRALSLLPNTMSVSIDQSASHQAQELHTMLSRMAAPNFFSRVKSDDVPPDLWPRHADQAITLATHVWNRLAPARISEIAQIDLINLTFTAGVMRTISKRSPSTSARDDGIAKEFQNFDAKDDYDSSIKKLSQLEETDLARFTDCEDWDEMDIEAITQKTFTMVAKTQQKLKNQGAGPNVKSGQPVLSQGNAAMYTCLKKRLWPALVSVAMKVAFGQGGRSSCNIYQSACVLNSLPSEIEKFLSSREKGMPHVGYDVTACDTSWSPLHVAACAAIVNIVFGIPALDFYDLISNDIRQASVVARNTGVRGTLSWKLASGMFITLGGNSCSTFFVYLATKFFKWSFVPTPGYTHLPGFSGRESAWILWNDASESGMNCLDRISSVLVQGDDLLICGPKMDDFNQEAVKCLTSLKEVVFEGVSDFCHMLISTEDDLYVYDLKRLYLKLVSKNFRVAGLCADPIRNSKNDEVVGEIGSYITNVKTLLSGINDATSRCNAIKLVNSFHFKNDGMSVSSQIVDQCIAFSKLSARHYIALARYRSVLYPNNGTDDEISAFIDAQEQTNLANQLCRKLS